MHRCLQLAAMGAGAVAPNPMVGSVLVHKGRIIGEGFHRQYGQAHAEVNCINSVQPQDLDLIKDSTLYVSLEPCAHHGKTPPCADLIIKHQIKKVVVGCADPFKEVDGKGIGKLRQAGVEVATNVLEAACTDLNKRFFTFHRQQRPYVILKWAQSVDGFIAAAGNAAEASDTTVLHSTAEAGGHTVPRTFISNQYSNRLVHKWRSEEASILVGTHTAMMDNPALTNRLWQGKNPVRLVIDKHLQLSPTAQLLNAEAPTIVFNYVKHEQQGLVKFYQLNEAESLVRPVLQALYEQGLNSVLVEGGAKLLQAFIDEGCWDEARIIINQKLRIGNGVAAPAFNNAQLMKSENYENDLVQYWQYL